MRWLLVACTVAVTAGAVVSIAAGGSTGAPAGRWVIRDLGTLGGAWSEAVAINERGQVAGTSVTKRGRRHAFLWENGRMRDLGSVGPRWSSSATGINAAGQVIGDAQWHFGPDHNDVVEHAVLWERGRTRDLGAPTRFRSNANDINTSGEIAGDVVSDSLSWHAYLWKQGTWSRIGLPKAGEFVDSADGINDAGQVVGTFRSSWSSDGGDPPEHVFLWEDGSAHDLGRGAFPVLNERGAVLIQWVRPRVYRDGSVILLDDPTGRPGRYWGIEDGFDAVALNDRGWVVGTDHARTLPRRAALWINGRMRRLGTLGGKTSGAVAVNDRGQIVGRSALAGNGGFHAFVWEKGRMTDLGTLHGLVSEAVAINNRGKIVGSVITRAAAHGDDAQRHAVLWTWQPAR